MEALDENCRGVARARGRAHRSRRPDGLGFGAAVRRAENLDLVDLDAFIDYLQHQAQPVAAPNDKRFVIALRP